MSQWNDHDLGGKIEQILADLPLGNPEGHHFGRPYLSAYQLAIEMNGASRRRSRLFISQSVGPVNRLVRRQIPVVGVRSRGSPLSADLAPQRLAVFHRQQDRPPRSIGTRAFPMSRSGTDSLTALWSLAVGLLGHLMCPRGVLARSARGQGQL